MTVSHVNNGNCRKCDAIFDAYYGFNHDLRGWFKQIQRRYVEAHISCAGRGKEAQEQAVLDRRSRAHFGQSAHNFNAAIDMFCNGKELYDPAWFKVVVEDNLTPNLIWYGRPNSHFYELPHIELAGWGKLVSERKLKLVA